MQAEDKEGQPIDPDDLISERDELSVRGDDSPELLSIDAEIAGVIQEVHDAMLDEIWRTATFRPPVAEVCPVCHEKHRPWCMISRIQEKIDSP